MSSQTDERRVAPRTKRVIDSPIYVALWALVMAWQVWFQGDILRHGGFNWVRVGAIALAGFTVGCLVTRLPAMRRLIFRTRSHPQG